MAACWHQPKYHSDEAMPSLKPLPGQVFSIGMAPEWSRLAYKRGALQQRSSVLRREESPVPP
jgi:hypothetical protein